MNSLIQIHGAWPSNLLLHPLGDRTTERSISRAQRIPKHFTSYSGTGETEMQPPLGQSTAAVLTAHSNTAKQLIKTKSCRFSLLCPQLSGCNRREHAHQVPVSLPLSFPLQGTRLALTRCPAGQRPLAAAMGAGAQEARAQTLTLLSMWDWPTRMSTLEARMETQKFSRMMERSDLMNLHGGQREAG